MVLSIQERKGEVLTMWWVLGDGALVASFLSEEDAKLFVWAKEREECWRERPSTLSKVDAPVTDAEYQAWLQGRPSNGWCLTSEGPVEGNAPVPEKFTCWRCAGTGKYWGYDPAKKENAELACHCRDDVKPDVVIGE